MSDTSVNSILKVKYDDDWIEIPALKGSSVYTLPAEPTSHVIPTETTTIVQTGYILKVVDEKKKAADPSYVCDEYTLWNGLDGTGSVNSVDGLTITTGTTNINLQAVSYGRAQPSLTSAEQLQARSNINAQVAGNYIASPSTKLTNQFLQYLGNDQWTTSTVQVLPASPTVGMLMKSSSSLDDLVWVPALSTTEIDNILAD